LGQISRNE